MNIKIAAFAALLLIPLQVQSTSGPRIQREPYRYTWTIVKFKKHTWVVVAMGINTLSVNHNPDCKGKHKNGL